MSSKVDYRNVLRTRLRIAFTLKPVLAKAGFRGGTVVMRTCWVYTQQNTQPAKQLSQLTCFANDYIAYTYRTFFVHFFIIVTCLLQKIISGIFLVAQAKSLTSTNCPISSGTVAAFVTRIRFFVLTYTHFVSRLFRLAVFQTKYALGYFPAIIKLCILL